MAHPLRFGPQRSFVRPGNRLWPSGNIVGSRILAHVLFIGDIQQYPALRTLLWQWGVTVGRLPEDSRSGVQATVEDCDAVVQLNQGSGQAEIDFGAMPDGAEAEGEVAAAAPLLAIGSESENSWITISEVGPGGSRLKVALQSCLERARVLRGESGSRHDGNQFRDFVGHELRSPLTAVKTALTALGNEKPPGPGSVRMLELAMRNLERLADTVEWSQELRSLAETVPGADLVPVPAAAVAGVIPDHLEVRLEKNCESGEILTDLGLLGILTRQMERVFSYACPGNHPVFRLEFDPDSGDCRLSARVSENEKEATANRVSRSGGKEAGLDKDMWNRTEFENLTRMLISPHLLQVLGVKSRIRSGLRGVVELSIGLPMWSAAASAAREPLCTV